MSGGLYIHIPFCVSKCAYCDFVSFSGYGQTQQTDYIDALLKEADLYQDFKPQTLYIGGGTPSVLTEWQIERLSRAIIKKFGDISSLKESTFEANPESLTESKIKLLKDLGFSRLSVGMQASDDRHLKLIARAHNCEQFFKIYARAQKYFNNINIDIIAGLPKQTLKDFELTVKKTAALSPRHISVYGLEVKEETLLYKTGYKTDEDLIRLMLELTYNSLTRAGYGQYEISNYAQKGFESVHNINYWDSGGYLGLGVSAASYLNGVRSQNADNLQEYIKKIKENKKPIVFREKLKGKALLGEKIMLALRKTEGIKLTDEIKVNFENSIKRLLKEGLLAAQAGHLRLTEEGKYLANAVFRHFVEPF
jgi:oxygen-independent coproporphyrinogen-3 oxidase